MFKTFIDYGVYLAVRFVICFIQAAPLPFCERVARRVAIIAYDVLRIRRKVVDDNIAQSFPEFSEDKRAAIAREMWAHLLLMVCEIAHAPRKLHQTNWKEHANILRLPEFVRRLLDERPLIVISGHFGNFELGGYLLGMFGFPTHSIARPLDNRFLHDFVNRFRGATGQHIVPKLGSRETIAEILRDNGTVALLGDQAAGDKACWVEFFGRPASTHKAVAVLPLGAEAPLLVSYVRRAGGPMRYEMGVEGIADPKGDSFQFGSVPALAQWYTDRLEGVIRRSPEQYWWLHRRWKGRPPESALRRIAARTRARAA